ncbi:MAG: CoA transferase [Candidatus Obscuribacterales bacterium]|nr:CoA transferase [Candidatus Obscuribacterales bacterium]
MAPPLENVKVVDFTHLLPGELTSSVLTDLGAHVTRVEKLKPGLAQFLPPIVKGESLYFWSVHRDEKRIAVDLKSKRALEIVHRLIKDADVLVENFRPGVMGRLGLGYGNLHKLNPRLIYCSISSYGQNSSFSQRPGHDINLQAETGVMHVTRSPEGVPLMPGTLLSDFMSAMLGSISILAAMHERERTGKGRHLDISMFDSVLWTQCLTATSSLYTGTEPREADPVYRQELANYNVFKCKDGRYIAAAPLEPQFWEIFCKALGREDLLNVFAFGPNIKLRDTLAAEFSKKTMAEWIEQFKEAECCISPVNTIREALEFIPAKERALIQNLIHPVLGEVPQLRTPLPFDRKHGAEIDAQTDIVASTRGMLEELGYSDDEIESLIAEKIIPAKQTAKT